MIEGAASELQDAAAAAAHFGVAGRVVDAATLAGGHIHASFRVACVGPRGVVRYVVQRLNERVFPRLADVAENLRRVTAHLRAKAAASGGSDLERRVLTPAPARDGALIWRDAAGRAWRAFAYIDGAVTRTRAASPADAEQAGRAFGQFQLLCADLPGPPLHTTIPGFHDTPKRLSALEAALRIDTLGRALGVAAEAAEIDRRRGLAWLAGAAAAGPLRVVHNDAKLSNVLLDERSGAALCVVDLDTVMPGLVLDDFGDMVRSLTATHDENESDVSRVAVDPQRFAALADGYLSAAGELLTPSERALLIPAAQRIIYEQAIRFLTDYVCGDAYFRTSYAQQNLHRARNQLALLASLEAQADELARRLPATARG